jgi:hypothetical protein
MTKEENRIMRKYQQQQILNIFNTIQKGQKEALYNDCQECVQSCIRYIEGINSNCTKTIELLKEHEALLEKAKTAWVDKDLLKKRLRYIEKVAAEEFQSVQEKPDIVFLSYKASMSDSIESIYLAAKNDPDVNVYFIPIPYYNKDEPSKMIYEGAECYGENIECTYYRDYDITTRYPDVIFTFNPYDNINVVTSIHPDYYCALIQNYTGYLVYIPYATSDKDIVNYDLFCITPGNVYADKVFIESDFVRDFYIKVFEAAYNEKYGNAKEKFIAIGSPKYDKVINTKREDYALPGQWEKLTENKKIVLYNTSVASVIDIPPELFLTKIHSVFETFRKRDDVLLWHRPHPLTEATFKTMRQSVYDEYRQIIEEYKTGGFGIYDDTTDLHRAIAWSDIHYGDENSVALMYLVTGKPVIIQHYTSKLNPWSTLDEQNGDIITEMEKVPILPDNSFAYNLDGTCGEKIWEYVKKETGLCETLDKIAVSR